MNSFMYSGTSSENFKEYYPNCQPIFKTVSQTLMSKKVALIHAISVVAFAILIALGFSETILFWPVAIASSLFVARKLYSQFFIKDPLMETFYKIVGGKDKFENLPKITLTEAPTGKICDVIKKIEWKDLQHPMTLAKTADGRNIIFIKSLEFDLDREETVSVFVEKLNEYDYARPVSNMPELAAKVLRALAEIFGTTWQSVEQYYSSSGPTEGTKTLRASGIYDHIKPDFANELYAQFLVQQK